MNIIEERKDSKWGLKYYRVPNGLRFVTGHYPNCNAACNGNDLQTVNNVIVHGRLKRHLNRRGYREVNQRWYEEGTPILEQYDNPEHWMDMEGVGMIELLKAIEVGNVKLDGDVWEGLWTFHKQGQIVTLSGYVPKLKSSHL